MTQTADLQETAVETQSLKQRLRKFFIRSRWEKITITAIILGIFMLMQPFLQFMFTYSFIVILVGTLGFVAATHFPED